MNKMKFHFILIRINSCAEIPNDPAQLHPIPSHCHSPGGNGNRFAATIFRINCEDTFKCAKDHLRAIYANIQ